jgi:hypothetical protein
MNSGHAKNQCATPPPPPQKKTTHSHKKHILSASGQVPSPQNECLDMYFAFDVAWPLNCASGLSRIGFWSLTTLMSVCAENESNESSCCRTSPLSSKYEVMIGHTSSCEMSSSRNCTSGSYSYSSSFVAIGVSQLILSQFYLSNLSRQKSTRKPTASASQPVNKSTQHAGMCSRWCRK